METSPFQSATISKEELQQNLLSHVAWRGELSSSQRETLLNASQPYTYLLAKDQDQFMITWKQPDGSFGHAHFELIDESETNQSKWFYANRSYHYSLKIDDLIPAMLHCEKELCHPLQSCEA